ncbi:MAG: DUF6464 family protein [Synechococcales cyanobacterium]
MDSVTLPTRIINSLSGETLDCRYLTEVPHPGHTVDVAGHPYTVLEKRHSYHLSNGRYRLHAIQVLVQPGIPLQGLGDLSCLYNAHSPLLRCTVHPYGPCTDCPDYRPANPPHTAASG